jgi:N6-adenosine-specific RNA methylase IME4
MAGKTGWVRVDHEGRAEGDGLPAGPFGVLFADPPWPYAGWVAPDLIPSRAGLKPYEPMTLEELHALPVASLAAKDCVLVMWTTSANLAHAMALGAAWGFTYSSLGLIWVKVDKTGRPRMGMGHWFRQEAEVSLLFTRGKPKRISKGVRQLILAQRREHSRKPDSGHDRLRDLVKGPHLEMFGRRPRFGWTVWGDEVNKFGGDDVSTASIASDIPAPA